MEEFQKNSFMSGMGGADEQPHSPLLPGAQSYMSPPLVWEKGSDSLDPLPLTNVSPSHRLKCALQPAPSAEVPRHEPLLREAARLHWLPAKGAPVEGQPRAPGPRRILVVQEHQSHTGGVRFGDRSGRLGDDHFAQLPVL